ncbi:MAG: hypothetical protein J1E80_01275 [Desulfovibrionaceae bacterium]|nr:hypothetical protein [Desulfovibrionaceae bacterium]
MRVLVLLALLIWTPAISAAADSFYAGYRSLVSWRPGTDIRLDAAVWYPTRTRPGTVKAGAWTFSAARGAALLPGPWPLLILSPDSSGSRFAHHDLAARLAGQGFVVVVLTHDGDNADDMRFLYTNLHLPTRARQLKAALDLVLADPQLGKAVDTQKIGLLAFGGGGSAGLLLAGATLTPHLWAPYCASPALKSGGIPDPYCEPRMAAHMDGITRGMLHQADAIMEATALRDQALKARAMTMARARDNVNKNAARLRRGQRRPLTELPAPPVFTPLLPPLPAEHALTDARFRAMMLISPGYSMLFDPNSLKSLNLPLSLVGLDRDPLHRPERQALVLRELLASSTAEYTLLTGADGPALQALCPPDMAQDLPDLCRTVSPGEREALHRRLEGLIVSFFQRAFR